MFDFGVAHIISRPFHSFLYAFAQKHARQKGRMQRNDRKKLKKRHTGAKGRDTENRKCLYTDIYLSITFFV